MSALAGTVVLDLSRGFPGARSAMFLGDFRTEVILIDPPTGKSTSSITVVEVDEGA